MTKRSARFLSMLLAIVLAIPFAAWAAETTTFTDSAGRTVTLPKDIRRIAPSGPLAQMVLIALVPERLVGLSSAYDDQALQYLRGLTQLPVIGQLYGTRGDLNLEELARLDPQLIIDIGESKPGIKEDMDALQEQLGIPCVYIGINLKDAPQAYRVLGRLLDVDAKAEQLAVFCDRTYQRAQSIALKAAGDKVRLLYCMGEQGLNVVARGSYHAEVIDMVADNAAVVDNPSSKGTGNEVDMEQIYLWDPDFIVFAPGSVYEKVGDDPLWQGLKAIREGRYAEAPQSPYNWMGFPASVQRYLGMLWLQKLLYPAMADYDLQAEVTQYYLLFYGHELSGE